MFEPKTIKKDFPIFKNHPTMVYLDSAATSQKPQQVIDAISNYYETSNANIHRGVYTLSEQATEQYEGSRKKTAKFINAASPKEIIFTRNTTEAINLLAYTMSFAHRDEIIVSELEHHSNLIPWQEVCKRSGATLKIIPIKDDLSLNLDAYHKLLSTKTKLVAITGMSNVLGTKTPLPQIIEAAHKHKALVLVDGAQLAAHEKVDMQALNCDFFTLSSHKMLGPTGVGVLYGKEELLNDLSPFLFGGDMIKSVSQHDAVYADLPAKFEAGTPNIAGVIGFGAALDYLNQLDFNELKQHEQELFNYTCEQLSQFPKVKLLIPPSTMAGPVISFTVKGIHPHDLASVLNKHHVCIRAGHHCAEPLMEKLQVRATSRISFHLYNDKTDIDKAIEAIKKAIELFAHTM